MRLSPIVRAKPFTVVICGGNEDQRQTVVALVRSCGARPVEIDDVTIPGALSGAAHSSVATVALGHSLEDGSPALDAIRTLAANGFTVIAHGRGASSWAISMRCRALLAGTACTLDDESAGFEQVLRAKIERLLHAERRRRDDDASLVRLMTEVGLVGHSPVALSLFRWVARVSKLTDLPTLITGETGTGKELLARAIHALDPKRSRRPFVPVNCGAISPGLVESELFGYRRGAFTGAERDRKGLIRSAEGGVLFLDEISELDLPAQTRLLRVLQERRVLGVGEDAELPVDVRVVAASNRDLDPMIRAHTFRVDLFYRLSVLTVHVPPLRNRSADIKPLVAHFVEKHGSLHPAPVSVAPEFIDALMSINLPGNVRQLENLVRQALATKEPDTPLELAHLPPEIWERVMAGAVARAEEDGHPFPAPGRSTSDLQSVLDQLLASGWTLSRSLRYCERTLVESALRLAHGNQSRTARLLGITPRCVYKKLHRHGLRA